MQIINDLLVSSSEVEILSELENSIKQTLDANFKLKDGGILDNILKILISDEIRFQENIEYFSKQFNPETAESIWQDVLYERLGIERLPNEYAQLTKEIIGTPNSEIKQNTILIRSDLSGKEFTNKYKFTINSNGYAAVEFIATSTKISEIDENETFKIVKAPASVNKFSENPAKNIILGRERELDENFKIRFRNSKSYNSKATSRANISNLSKYLPDSSYISIKDKNEDRLMDPNTVLITAKHTTTDRNFAEAIFNTFGCGIKFLGTTSVILKDVNGKNVTVKFNNATEIPIYIDATVKIKDSQFEEIVINSIKENILSYLNNRKFGLGGTIYATELAIPILKHTLGVESIENIKIKATPSGEYTSIIQLNNDEIAAFNIERITVTKENNNETN